MPSPSTLGPAIQLTLSRHQPQPRLRAFTLVELLVVIGIIALLVSILMPALSKAQKQTRQVMCANNLRQIGMAVVMYSNQNKGVVLPTIIWGVPNPAAAPQTNVDDSWGHLLVASGLASGPASQDATSIEANESMFMCPEVRGYRIVSNVPGVAGEGGPTSTDGYERRKSSHVQPGLLIDYGYGINGASYRQSDAAFTNVAYTVPSTSISTRPDMMCIQPKKMSSIRRNSDMVLMYDGVAWNGFGAAERCAGSRHGKFNGLTTQSRFATGKTNVLFLDGHVVTADRASLPSNSNQWIGTRSQMRNPNDDSFLFSTNQLN